MRNWFKKLLCKRQATTPTISKQHEIEPKEPETQIDPTPAFNFTIKTECVEREPVGELSHLDFGKTTGELGCFLNYEPRTLWQPTDRQLEYLKDLGVFIPEGITNIDASCMLSRVEDDEEDPSPELVDLATGLKLGFSAFVGNESLFCVIVHTGNDRDRAALYAYAVSQSMKGRSFGNMLEDPDCSKFYAFADQVLVEPSLMRSLLDRPTDDFKKPHRGTAIYKAAATFLNNK